MEKIDPIAFNKPECSNNLTKLLMKRKENIVTRILATNFHTELADESGASKEIRLNPFMKDLIINGYAYGSYMQAGESKMNNRQKKEIEDEMVEGIG
jgi:hypothetical protein